MEALVPDLFAPTTLTGPYGPHALARNLPCSIAYNAAGNTVITVMMMDSTIVNINAAANSYAVRTFPSLLNFAVTGGPVTLEIYTTDMVVDPKYLTTVTATIPGTLKTDVGQGTQAPGNTTLGYQGVAIDPRDIRSLSSNDLPSRSWALGSGDTPARSWALGAGDVPSRGWALGSGDTPGRSWLLGGTDAPNRSWALGSGDTPNRSWALGSGDTPLVRGQNPSGGATNVQTDTIGNLRHVPVLAGTDTPITTQAELYDSNNYPIHTIGNITGAGGDTVSPGGYLGNVIASSGQTSGNFAFNAPAVPANVKYELDWIAMLIQNNAIGAFTTTFTQLQGQIYLYQNPSAPSSYWVDLFYDTATNTISNTAPYGYEVYYANVPQSRPLTFVSGASFNKAWYAANNGPATGNITVVTAPLVMYPGDTLALNGSWSTTVSGAANFLVKWLTHGRQTPL